MNEDTNRTWRQGMQVQLNLKDTVEDYQFDTVFRAITEMYACITERIQQRWEAGWRPDKNNLKIITKYVFVEED